MDDSEGALRYAQEAERQRQQALEEEKTAVSLRLQAISRMEGFNRNHAALAWKLRRSTPILPYGLAFLYSDPVPVTSPTGRHSASGTLPPAKIYQRVIAATRVDYVLDDDMSLLGLLSRLIKLATERYIPEGLDPANQLVVYRDESETKKAEYIGLGVSALDTQHKTWAQAQTTAQRADDVGGLCLAILYDQTHIKIERNPSTDGYDDVVTHSTGDLNFNNIATRPWHYHPDTTTMQIHPNVWVLMHQLHALIYEQQPRPTL